MYMLLLRSELLFFDVLLLNSLTQSTKAAANQTTVGPRVQLPGVVCSHKSRGQTVFACNNN
jgi:hypothetical protein